MPRSSDSEAREPNDELTDPVSQQCNQAETETQIQSTGKWCHEIKETRLFRAVAARREQRKDP